MNNQIRHNITNESGEQLEKAFQLFNEYSEKLTGSYGDLQTRVAQMASELAIERNQRLIQLAEKEQLAIRLEGLLDALPAGIVVLDAKGEIVQTNRVANEILGFEHKANKLLGKKWSEIASHRFIYDGSELHIEDGRCLSISVSPLAMSELAASTSAGSSDNSKSSNKKCSLYESGKIILLSDVSEIHALHQALNQQQRLSTLGEMIAGLAHQIRTPLSSALLYISTANHPSTNQEKRLSLSDKAKQRLCHLDRMVNDMLNFARGDVVDAEKLNAQVLYNRLEKMIQSDYASQDICLLGDEDLQDAEIKINPDVILSAIQNIINNAIEACIDKKENKAGESHNIQIKTSINNKNKLDISITDNGIGMSDELQSKILEPFYTTKINGTGLGLSVVNATINRYGGELKIYSEQGKGSSFCISFTCIEKESVLPENLISAKFNQNNLNLEVKTAYCREV